MIYEDFAEGLYGLGEWKNIQAIFGFPFVPVIKVTGNPYTYSHVMEHIDVFGEITDEAGAAVAGAEQVLYKRL